MDEQLKFKPFGISALILILIGWGGLYYIITQTLPYVWPRWAFFVLVLLALTGTALPIIYFFHKRFPSDLPAEANVLLRQAMWFGVYGATLAWLQLGRLVTVYVILSLAGGLIAIEYDLNAYVTRVGYLDGHYDLNANAQQTSFLDGHYDLLTYLEVVTYLDACTTC